jgi:hypothetical protein
VNGKRQAETGRRDFRNRIDARVASESNPSGSLGLKESQHFFGELRFSLQGFPISVFQLAGIQTSLDSKNLLLFDGDALLKKEDLKK